MEKLRDILKGVYLKYRIAIGDKTYKNKKEIPQNLLNKKAQVIDVDEYFELIEIESL